MFPRRVFPPFKVIFWQILFFVRVVPTTVFFILDYFPFRVMSLLWYFSIFFLQNISTQAYFSLQHILSSRIFRPSILFSSDENYSPAENFSGQNFPPAKYVLPLQYFSYRVFHYKAFFRAENLPFKSIFPLQKKNPSKPVYFPLLCRLSPAIYLPLHNSFVKSLPFRLFSYR